LKTESFIQKANKVHNFKYDYSLVEYVDSSTKVKIICPKHGVFEQTPSKHLIGQKCRKCAYDNKKLNVQDFIEKSNKIHNFKYDYSLVQYVNNSTKVKIICPEHGIFEQKPNSHLNGRGCAKCYGNELLTTKSFIQKANQVHNFKYDYSLVDYKNSKTKVKIICPEHGVFEQIPCNHIFGKGCAECSGKFMTTEKFIEKSIKKHGDKYDYSLVEYVDSSTKVKIIFNNKVFLQSPSNHLNNNVEHNKMDIDDFIEKSKKIFLNRFDYSLVDYKNSKTKVKIICPKHGVFLQTPNSHLSGRCCPKCNYSKGEIAIENFLIENNFDFESQKSFPNCKNKNLLFFDFYLKEYNLCIEFDGKQHFEIIEKWGGFKRFEEGQLNDKIKTKYCVENNINLLRINYKEDLILKLKEFFNI
jgi:hypothetical protein